MHTKIKDYITKHYTGGFKGYTDICFDIYRHFKKDTHYYGDNEFQVFAEWMRSEQRIFDVHDIRRSAINDLLFILGEENTGDCIFDEEKAEELMLCLVYESILRFFIFEVKLYRVLERLNTYEALTYADFRDLKDAQEYIKFLKEKK